MTGWVGEDPERLAATAQPRRPQLESSRLARVEVVDDDIQVRLLWLGRIRRSRWVVPGDLLKEHALSVSGYEGAFRPVVGDLHAQ